MTASLAHGATFVLMTLSAIGLSACGSDDEMRPTFDGVRFNATASAESRQDRAAFTAVVRGAEASLTGAVQAAEHEGIRHCITYFGTSDIAWQVGPDTPPEALPIENGTLRLTGRCRD